jgi:hypothetical protein
LAVTPQQIEESFLREVDEELRREQIGTFWRRYGRALVAVILIGLAALGGFLWWQAEQQKKADAEGEQLVAVLNDVGVGKEPGARLDPLINSRQEGYRAAARLTKAAIAAGKGDAKAAIVQYKLIADDKTLDAPLRDLALIRQTALEFDMLPPDEVVARLKPLAEAGGPWFGSAGEMVAIAYMKMNKPELAGPIFQAIAKDENAPETIRARATRLAGALGVDAVAEPTAKKD